MQILRGFGGHTLNRGGGTVIVQGDGSIDITPKSGEVVTVSGSLAVTGIVNLSERLSFTANGSGTVGSIFKDATHGLIIRGVTGATNEFSLQRSDGLAIMNIPDGTINPTFLGDVTVTGDHIVNGISYVGGTTNANMTQGLTINQGANADELFAGKSSDVAHGMTALAETNTYGFLRKSNAAAGGLFIRGLSDADAVAGQALILSGVLGEAADTTKSTSAVAIVEIDACIKSGTGAAAAGSNGNLLTVSNCGTVRFIFDAEGDSHQDVGTVWTNFDDRDDALMTRSLAIVMDKASVIKSKWDDFGRDHYEDIIECGLIPRLTPKEIANGDRALVNMTQHARLLNGVAWQHEIAIKDGRERQEAIKDCLRGLVEANPTLEGRTEALALLEIN